MTRVDSEKNVWLATVRPDGRPHLTPIWFAFVDGRFWICTGADTVKATNIRVNERVSVSLEDGTAPVVAEGTATIHERPYPPAVVDAFAKKFEWDISRTDDPDGPFDALLEITVSRWLMGNASA